MNPFINMPRLYNEILSKSITNIIIPQDLG